MSMNFEDKVRCNHCMKVFYQNEVIYDEEQTKNYVPIAEKTVD